MKIVPAQLMIPAIALVLIFSFTACSSHKTELKVFNAGSLMVPFAEIERAFETEHPNVDVRIEGHGSIQVIRHVTELHEEVDVMAVADYSLLPMMMYDTTMPDTTESYANWHVKFATNRLGIAYTSLSKHAQQITDENWHEILSRPDVAVGISDPRFDSCGYRAFIMCQLANLHYGDHIFEKVLGEFSPAIIVEEKDNIHTVVVPEVLRPQKMFLRGSSVVLLATLQSGDIDYAFMYQSVAEQFELEFLELPPEIDLSSEDHSDYYGRVSCRLSFQRFATVDPEFIGQEIVYGLTVPRNAPHPGLAAEFIAFILSTEGQEILTQAHQPVINHPTTDQLENVPTLLKPVLQQE
ncbi:MAG: tungstate ABC transporter substrate-binding protein WtpA [Chloroflexota bacterium]|nr:tungstate ABC transporter substrate-binding protein WtpA [Chloroflexota bacterium]